MLTAVAIELLLVLLGLYVIHEQLDWLGEIKGEAETMNQRLADIKGTLSDIHNTILELWACPLCLGSGLAQSGQPGVPLPNCDSCKGTGMRANVQASVSFWETATLVATVASAVFTSVSALLGIVAFYRRKRLHTHLLPRLDRKIGFERSSLAIAILASGRNSWNSRRPMHRRPRACDWNDAGISR